MEDKIIITNRDALSGKYDAQDVKLIDQALADLVAADNARGINTRIVDIANASAMKKLKGRAVLSKKDVRGAKAAVDAIYAALKPDYLMLLGSTDVIPHQDLRNPAYRAGDDDDRLALGDLPYACDTAYGNDPANFVGPTRMVARLPDLTGAKEPSHLVALLKTAANWKQRKAEDYESYFGLSASVWKGSTAMSLDNIFGNNKSLLLAPPKGPSFPAGKLGALMHFINCHGALATPEFYGQMGSSYPVSLATKTVGAKIKEGTIASVECCYGGELYNSELLGLDIPICQSYLRQGAYGYFGSTTIAYGPADGNGAADLLCQYFLLNVLSGASIGHATLSARQQFVANTAQMDPIDLKTLAQFCLYGDPSIHPVLKARAAHVPVEAKAEETERFRRGETRAKLQQTGVFLQETKPTASKPAPKQRPAPQAKAVLAKLAKENGLDADQPFVAYKVKGAVQKKVGQKKLATAPSRYYLAVGRPGNVEKNAYRVAVVAKEVNGRVVDYCVYYQR